MHVKTNPLAPAGSILQQTQCMYLLSMTFHVQDIFVHVLYPMFYILALFLSKEILHTNVLIHMVDILEK